MAEKIFFASVKIFFASEKIFFVPVKIFFVSEKIFSFAKAIVEMISQSFANPIDFFGARAARIIVDSGNSFQNQLINLIN